MTTFEELYGRLVKASVQNRLPEELEQVRKEKYDPHQLDCLLNPEKHPPVIRIGDCACSEDERAACAGKCLFDALYRDEKGNLVVDPELCVGCEDCVENCKAHKLTESRDILPALEAIHHADAPVYAMIAPAFINQFSSEVTPGKLRSAFKRIGFAGMVEVALFADILTLKEALEFDRNILKEEDYQLTSCCCPMWISMIRRVYHELIPHVPGAVSPMVACGRSIKTLYPKAVTVFIGPCLAKKAEAREKDVADSTDHVLTFREMRDIFDFAGIDPAKMPEDERDHSSRAGRIYASTGGVSEAVQKTVERLNPDRKITVKAAHADGVPGCKKMLSDVLAGHVTANFIEGMGCVGGCVGGPRALIPAEEGRKNVRRYGDEAAYPTPIDNPFVIELLHRLGFDTVESLLEHSDIFTRDF
ncbi:iron hydrogenase [Caproiciproducens sp. NJN-50]|uniref:[Fe-Fe] hydrogenase large subunit C-terminal domain-containing protein n=1 Tax=Acutalibacteraceae TaxID=3082771 RepID=UPI000FFE087E|nr:MULTISPECIES: [Fe-Fe] hydrogenase large subunit C-terminal domain-containing protein [Acutalibacteraceae]QAT49051.1 iron hydrogenase [Caproiciproducens sp. NJN-50]